jgi:hypothetical protein
MAMDMSRISDTSSQDIDKGVLSTPMSTAAPLYVPRDDIDANLRRNVGVLMAGNGVKASSLYRALGLSRQAFSARMKGVTRFTLAEALVLAELLGATVEMLTGPTQQVVQAQNWKLFNAPDLRILPGDPPSENATRGTQLQLPVHLHLVKS